MAPHQTGGGASLKEVNLENKAQSQTGYEPGKPEDVELGRWRQKLQSRGEKLRYLQTAERSYYSKEGFGSEKRKNPA